MPKTLATDEARSFTPVWSSRLLLRRELCRLQVHPRDLKGRATAMRSCCRPACKCPALAVIDEVERQSGLPTLSAATATTWAILRALELEPVVPGAGALLAPTPEPVAY